jgi:tetratricopeptide (TPR) repeat protein
VTEVENALARLAFGARRWPQAIEHARAAIAADPNDPRGHEVLALALKLSGDNEGALTEFSAAKEKNSRDFQPYFEVAVAEQNAGAGPTGAANFSSTEARHIANDYERVINLNPRFQPAYENLAGVIILADPWGESDRQFLQLGQRIFPEAAMIRVGLAVLKYRGGDYAAARTELEAIINNERSGTVAARGYARRLAEGWEQQEASDEINRLIVNQKLSEAVAAIDAYLARGGGPALRAQLPAMRRQLVVNLLTQKIQSALSERRWREARTLVSELMASDAPTNMKAQGQRTLADLDRNKLGLDEARE